jgi:hypothetical protein
VFSEWVAGQRPIPWSYAVLVGNILGVPADSLLRPTRRASQEGDLAPAIWFKMRSDNLSDADRECVFLIRQLSHFVTELEEATGKRAVGWHAFFQDVRDETDAHAPPREQGRRAARLFRTSRGLDSGSQGIGDIFRGNLRSIGVLVIESAIVGAKLEGCSFFVGSGRPDRPCLFANTYGVSWFRRNAVLLHELGHAIFEGEAASVSLDLFDEPILPNLAEERAQAFAEEFLLPQDVLHHLSQGRGIKWDSLTVDDMAWLMAQSHAEQRLVLSVARGAGLIDLSQHETYARLDVSTRLKELSEHALNAREFLARRQLDPLKTLVSGRKTTIPSRTLQLPVGYVLSVLEAYRISRVSLGKAAEMLMIDKRDFQERFADVVEAVERE